MAAETIKEFLIALGYKVDRATEKKFEDSITAATLKANLLADALVGMAKKLAESLQHAAGDLSDLYYASIRAGTSATNLKALQLAAQDFGVSAQEAGGYLEHLREILLTNPGKEGLINSLGVATRDANGELRDTEDILKDLGRALAQRPTRVANQFGGVLDMPFQILQMIRNPGFIGDLEKFQQSLSKGDYDGASRKAAVFEQQLRQLGSQWDKLKTNFESDIFGPLIGYFDRALKWLEQHEPQTEGFITRFMLTVEDFANRVKIVFGDIDWDKLLGTKQWGELIDGIKRFSDWVESKFDATKAVNNLQSWILDKLGLKDWADKVSKDLAAAPAPTLPSRGIGIAINNPGNLEYAGQPGAVRAGGSPFEQRFAAFPSPEAGLEAMGRQLGLDFHRGRTNLEALISKYAPPGENDTAGYIADVARQLHISGRQALNLDDPAQLANLMNAMIAHEQLQNPYPAGLVRGAAEHAIRSNGPTTITQNNTINIDGSRDISATKRAVDDALHDSLRRATRNLQPTTQ